MFNDFYKGKNVLVTGHTGFKGSWLSIWLHLLGANVTGFSVGTNTEQDNFVLSKIGEKILDIRGDIRDAEDVNNAFAAAKPEIVFHLAAQPLVRYSYQNPRETYEANVMGTLNVLEAVRATDSVKSAVMITTDKCYKNKEQLTGYKETDPMGGYDPYSSSKACCEILISSYRDSFFNIGDYERHKKAVCSVRAGNVIGGGDWSADRIIPDCIRATIKNEPVLVHNPNAVRPWQHVLEPLHAYLQLGMLLCEKPKEYSEGFNFGPDCDGVVTVLEVAKKLTQYYGKGEVVTQNEQNAPHEAKLLTLDITKAKKQLGFKPRFSIDEAIKLTADWYKRYQNEDVFAVCKAQIEEYCLK